MSDLSRKTCEVCRTGVPPVTGEETREYMAQLPEWEIIAVEGGQRLRRVFQFGDFKEALAFTDKVGALAEAENHHPSLLTEWGRVTVTWWTHKIGGLHVTDFIMAASPTFASNDCRFHIF